MSKNLYVGNLPYSVSDDDLKNQFSKSGTVKSAKVIEDRETHKSKGYGFVEMETDAEAEAAINDNDGNEFEGRELKVNEARPKASKSY